MGQVENALTYLAGTNQYQDPGLEPDRRERAANEVKKAIEKFNRRDVFKIDRMLSHAECQMVFWRDLPHMVEYWANEAKLRLEEMLSHGSC